MEEVPAGVYVDGALLELDDGEEPPALPTRPGGQAGGGDEPAAGAALTDEETLDATEAGLDPTGIPAEEVRAWLAGYQAGRTAAGEQPETAAYDPAEHDVDAVNAHLAEHPEQVEAVLAAEQAGKARKGILEGPHAPATP